MRFPATSRVASGIWSRGPSLWLTPVLAALLSVGLRPAAGQMLSPSAVVDPLAGRPVSRIEVLGNRTAETRLILPTSLLEPGRPADRERIREAVRALYGLGLFESIRVTDWPDSGEGRALAIEVTENPRLAAILWEGNKRLKDDDLRAKIDLRAGQVMTGRKLFEAVQAIGAAYRDEGYPSARVESRLEDAIPERQREEEQRRREEEARAREAEGEEATDREERFARLDRPVLTAVEGRKDLTFVVTEGGRVSIRAVEFAGATAFKPGDLQGPLALKPNSLFRRKRYTAERGREDREKLVEFYQNHGYKDVVVEGPEAVFADGGESVTLRYTVNEGPAYRFGTVRWSGNTAVPTEALQASSSVMRGEPYSRARLDATTGAAYELYTEKGHLLELSIQPEIETVGDTVSVAYRIQEGSPSRVREITIAGNTRTKERVIRRELSLWPGQLLRRSVLLRSHRDVFALGFFEDVQIDYEPVGIGSDVNVSFLVKEKGTGTATAGAGYAGDTGLTGFVQFGHNNLFGNGQALQLHLERGSRRRTYDISFTEPWVFNTPTSLGFQLYNTVREYDLYSARERGGGINLGRQLPPKLWGVRLPDYSRASLGYTLEEVRYSDLEDLDPESREILRDGNGTVSRVNMAFSRNSTDNPFNPTAGSRSLVRLELAGAVLGGGIHYYKPEIDHRVYFVPFWKPAVMLRNRVALVGKYPGEKIPGSETFRLGGTRTDYLRGYPDYEIMPEENVRVIDGREVRFPGGRFAYTFTAEYQFPIVNPVRGLVFFDAGNTWNEAGDFTVGNLKKGVGAGIRLEIPMLGVVGFDYGYGVDRGKWQSHFIIGPAF